MSDAKDYIGLVLFGAGSSYGRHAHPDMAADRARREANNFAQAFGGFKPGAAIAIMLFDVTGFDDVHFDALGAFALLPPEVEGGDQRLHRFEPIAVIRTGPKKVVTPAIVEAAIEAAAKKEVAA